MKGKLSIRLWGILNKENQDSITYQIAEHILQNIFTLDDTSSQNLAKVCNVSKASISRFCKELGYDSYYDFRLDLEKYTVNSGKAIAYEHVSGLGMVQAYLENCRKYLDILEQNVNEIELTQLVQLIAQTPKVYLMGHLQSGGTAENLQYNLFETKKMSRAVVEPGEQKRIFNTLSGRELIIIFSAGGRFFSDYFEDGVMPDVPRGTKVYYITSNPQAEIIPNVKMINTGTSRDIAACNLSLDIVGNIIFLKYKNYVQDKR